MEPTTETTNSVVVIEPLILTTPVKKRGRPPKAVDPTKLSSFFAAMGSADAQGRGVGYLQQVTGLKRNELKAVIRSLLKAGKIKQLGTKKGATYLMV